MRLAKYVSGLTLLDFHRNVDEIIDMFTKIPKRINLEFFIW